MRFHRRSYLCVGFRGHFSAVEWHFVVLFQTLTVILELYEGRYDETVPYCRKHLQGWREKMREWILEIISDIVEWEQVYFG